ncbi:MAG: hypothetical protein KZQ93_05705 [Candidatus Thiodiazotropha sp. (ex Monitilora ramsayi)]|nr:hypothetical protein [Candidatus Thiodiazotropha sp. (ex Monitilora ramsayi)]
MNRFAFFSILFLMSTFSIADSMENKKEALEIIANTADQICNKNVQQSSQSNEISLSGEVNAEIAGLVKKLVDLGIVGAGSYSTKETQGILQYELADSIKSQSNCKQGVFYALLEKLIPSEKNVNPFISNGDEVQVPEPISAVRSGQRFAMKLNDARLIAGSNIMMTLSYYSKNTPPIIRLRYTDLIDGKGRHVNPALGESASIENCKITYYAANKDERTASFYLSCD